MTVREEKVLCFFATKLESADVEKIMINGVRISHTRFLNQRQEENEKKTENAFIKCGGNYSEKNIGKSSNQNIIF